MVSIVPYQYSNFSIVISCLRYYLDSYFMDKSRSKLILCNPNEFDKHIEEFINTEKNLQLVTTLGYFFNQVSVCANESICVKELLCRRFGDDMLAFRNNFLAHYLNVSHMWNQNLNHESDIFLRSCGSKLRTLPVTTEGMCK